MYSFEPGSFSLKRSERLSIISVEMKRKARYLSEGSSKITSSTFWKLATSSIRIARATWAKAVKMACSLIHDQMLSGFYQASYTDFSNFSDKIPVTALAPTSLAVSLTIFPKSLLLEQYSSNCSSFVSCSLKSMKTSPCPISKCLITTSKSLTNMPSNQLSFSSL